MFSRKKKKNVAEGQADLAKQLGISLPGLGDPDVDLDDEGGDDALEEELLALMEEEAAAMTIPTEKSSGRHSSTVEDVEHDEQLLAELAEIQSETVDSPIAPAAPVRSSQPAPSEQPVIKKRPPVPQPRAQDPSTKKVSPAQPPSPKPRMVESGGPGHISDPHDLGGLRPKAPPEPLERKVPRDVPHETLLPQGNASVIPLPQHRDPDRLMASVPKQLPDRLDTASLIESRINNYEAALANARASQQDSKARRLERGLNTLKELQRKAKAGRPIPDGDIPPEVAISASQPTSVPTASVPPAPVQPTKPDENTHQLLCQRRDLYKMTALQSKKEGDPQTAMEFLKIAKQFDQVIAAAESGQEIDLSNMPPAPSELKKAADTKPQSSPPAADEPKETAPSNSEPAGMPVPRTILEGLLQRRDRYKSLAEKAAAGGNSSKARRLGRIVKQYEDAIKKEKSGRPVEYNELPELPDFPPLPLKGGRPIPPPEEPRVAPPPLVVAPHPVSPQKPAAVPRPQPPAGSPQADGTTEPSPTRKSVKESMNERQLKILLERQKKVKLQALQAKKQGDVEEAKRLIIIARGFDPMIEAAQNGLPVNMDSIPKIPEDSSPKVVSPPPEDIPADIQALTGDKSEMYKRLISTLQKQIEQCQSLAAAYLELGNSQTSKRFQEYSHASQEDKDVLMMAHQHNDPVPRFHFEQRTIPTLRITPGLKKEEAEITIIQGSDYKHQGATEEEIETYVKFEFPYPSDKPQIGQTGSEKGAGSFTYEYAGKVQVNLKARSFLSFVKRKSIKFEVIQKRGFLKGEKSLGTASLKLAELENKHEIEGTFPLYEGRKEIGGTLEARVRLHHPVSGMKEEFIKEKWLVVESKVGRGVSSPSKSSNLSTSPSKPAKPVVSPSKPANSRVVNSQVPDTIDVLKFEVMQLKKRNDQLAAQGKPKSADILATMQNHLTTIKGLEEMLKNNKTRQAYMARLQSNTGLLTEQAKLAQQQGNKDKVKLLIRKKQLVVNELEKLSGKR